MGGVLASTHSSLALAWTWEAVPVRTSAGVIMTTRGCTSQAEKQKKCENTNQINSPPRQIYELSKMLRCITWQWCQLFA